MRPTVGGVTAVTALCVFACSPAAAGDGRIVAKSDSGSITYSNIRCHPQLRRGSAACVRSEQEALNRWIYRRATECAARLERISLTNGDVAALEAQIEVMKPQFQRTAGRYRAVLRGVIRVQEGEKIGDVAAELRKLGVTSRELEHELHRFERSDGARTALEKDHTSLIEEATRDRMRHDLLLSKLKRRVEERSAASARPFSAEETAMWNTAVRACALRIVDDTYHMPELTGAFEIRAYEHVQLP